MVIRESYMFEFSVRKNMKTYIFNKGGSSRKVSSTFMSNSNRHRIKN